MERIPFAEYLKTPGMNPSTLVQAIVDPWTATLSMEQLKDAIDGKLNKPSDDKTFGRAFHTMLLEPDLFADQWRIQQGCCATLAKGGACKNAGRYIAGGSWYCGTHKPEGATEPEDAITEDEAARIREMCRKVKGHPVTRLIHQSGGVETTVRADLCGVPCKGRLDKYVESGPFAKTITDVKKIGVGKSNRAAFGREMLKWSYHVKAAMYVDLSNEMYGKLDDGRGHDFIWIAVEDSAPHGVYVHRMTQTEYAVGRSIYQAILRLYTICAAKGLWPPAHATLTADGRWQLEIDDEPALPESYLHQQSKHLQEIES
jgi:hypothetical protein